MKVLTDNGELYRHEEPKEVEQELQWWPFLSLEEPPGSRGQNQGVPSGDGKRAHEEVLVCRQMRRKIEVGREDLREVGDAVVGR